jgi:hypothetical protein
MEAAPGRRVPLVADTPLHDPALDRFGFAEFAHALTLIIDDEGTATPLTIAVSAPWGGGKSSLGCMVQTMLEQRVRNRGNDDPRLVCWFNAWEHDDAPHLGAALAASVARAADRNRALWRRLVAPLPSAMLRPSDRSRQTVIVGLASALAAVVAAILPPVRHLLEDLGAPDAEAAGAGVLGVVFFLLFVARRIFTTAREAARFIDDPRSAAARGTMSDVKAQFGRLIRHATHSGRLVIIIDDLERCSSDRALEVCQVASQLLAQPGVVTIVLADMEPIARSAGQRYAASMPGGGVGIDAEEIGRRYLAKIVQLEITLPPPVPAVMRRVIRDYGPSLRHAESDIQARRQSLRARRWERIRARLRAAAPRVPRGLRGQLRAWKQSERRFAGIWHGLERVIEHVRWWGVAFVFLAATVYAAANPAWANSDETDDPVSTTLGIAFLAAFLVGWWSRSMRRRKRQQRRTDLKERIEELKGKQLSPEEIEREVLQQASASPGTERGLISDLVHSSFLDSEEFRAVETFISENPPALPREAKRSFNHAQLLTEIARARHMFGGDPELRPAHLAKWLVLREQWPALGRAIAVAPDRLALLEAGDANGDVTPQARELLERAPLLGDVIERLVYFQSADERRAAT